VKGMDLAVLRQGYHNPESSDMVRDWFRMQIEKANAHFKRPEEEEE